MRMGIFRVIMLREFAAVAGVVLVAAFAATLWLPGAQPVAIPSKGVAQDIVAAREPVEGIIVVRPSRMPVPLFRAAPVADLDRDVPPDTVAEAPLAPEKVLPDPALAGQQAEAVARHLAAKIPPHLLPYFENFIYVSKAKSGSWAQNLFLFRKSAEGTFVFVENFLISTGRERSEKYFTTTPSGIFTLDPSRLFRKAYSAKWRNAPMPHAMFLDYSYRTQMSGVALHAAVGRAVGDLGHRASGGCVRLPPDKAAALFERVKNGPRAMVPVFAFDHERGTTNIRGDMRKDAGGRVILKEGLPYLLLIDDESGSAPTILSSL